MSQNVMAAAVAVWVGILMTLMFLSLVSPVFMWAFFGCAVITVVGFVYATLAGVFD